jgi:hypothetical protein
MKLEAERKKSRKKEENKGKKVRTGSECGGE